MKKAAQEPLTNGSFEPDSETPSTPSSPILNPESMSNNDVPNSTDMERDDAKDLSSLVLSGDAKSLVFSFTMNYIQCDQILDCKSFVLGVFSMYGLPLI